jgi:hypothetical protein
MINSNSSKAIQPPLLQSATLDGMELRLVEGLHCPHCNRSLRNFPDRLGHGFRLICIDCHHEILIYQRVLS